MYSKHESTRIKKEFWTTFGRYMKPIPNHGGELVNWLNYKTGVKHIFFRMDADEIHVSVGIEFNHPDSAARMKCFDEFVNLKSLFTETLGEEWKWQKKMTDDQGIDISRIGIELSGINVLNTDDWPAIISFLKPRILSLDTFWCMVKDSFLYQ